MNSIGNVETLTTGTRPKRMVLHRETLRMATSEGHVFDNERTKDDPKCDVARTKKQGGCPHFD